MRLTELLCAGIILLHNKYNSKRRGG